jgi:hypothetical protein
VRPPHWNRALLPALGEQVDHLAEGADRPLGEAACDLVEQAAHGLLEGLARWDVAVHEGCEGLVRVAAREHALLTQRLDVVAASLELRAESLPVIGARDHDRRLAGPKAGVEERADRRGELVELGVDLHSVPGGRSALEKHRPAHSRVQRSPVVLS